MPRGSRGSLDVSSTYRARRGFSHEFKGVGGDPATQRHTLMPRDAASAFSGHALHSSPNPCYGVLDLGFGV